MVTPLAWLPKHPNWNEALESARKREPAVALGELVRLSGFALDFLQTAKLDKVASRLVERCPDYRFRTPTVRLAVLGSSTVSHLLPGIRVAALRRGFWLELFEGDYGTYYQQLATPGSELQEFRPDFVLLAVDAPHLVNGRDSVAGSLELLKSCWEMAHELGAVVIQQALIATEPSLLGNNEHRLSSSPAARIRALNAELRTQTLSAGVELLAVDEAIQTQGLSAWHDRSLWFHAKQEVHPRMTPEYGDQAARLVAALRGLSSKCLVLDLDNTLWGGVVGDDGLNGIVLGQGNATGEAHVALQRYAKALSERGCLLAVCSKNDESVAREPFQKHPEMLLRLPDIAAFVANWQDKASNLRRIAESLNIGLDSLVFVDDNPFERELVRRELPMVSVPELPEDAAQYVACLAAAGYFEATSITAEDRARGQQYLQNAARDALRSESTNLEGYLRELEMKLEWAPFTSRNLTRITQLINKTNQFNLTTRRYGEPEVARLLNDPQVVGLQFRLADRFGDNGMIAVVIGKLEDRCLVLDSWLMSCRVLGRGVEDATLEIVAAQARKMGADSLLGVYLPSPKNGIVKDHYRKLGFDELEVTSSGESRWRLPLERAVRCSKLIEVGTGEAHAD